MSDYKAFSDKELVLMIAKNDHKAFEVLYDRYSEKLFVYCYKRLQLEDEAKDITQDLFINLWERRETLQINGEFEAYVYSIAKYKVLSVLNKAMQDQTRLHYIANVVLPSAQHIIDNIQLKELEQLINAEVSLLPDKMKEIYRLSREENLSNKEIAQKLTLSEQTVKNQLSSALGRLRIGLKEAFFLIALMNLLR